MRNKLVVRENSTQMVTTEYHVETNGDAYISQRELERLLGLSPSTISKYLSRLHPNYMIGKGLSPEMVETVCGYYAFDTRNPTEEAKAFAKVIMRAGAKDFIYHQAGYTLNATLTTHTIPQTYSEALLLAGNLAQEKEQLALELKESQELQVLSESLLLEAETKIEEDAPKVEIYDDLITTEEEALVGSIAKLLKIPPRFFFSELRRHGHLNQDNSPSVKAINAGYMSSRIHAFNYRGDMKYNITALITMKGLIFYRKKFSPQLEESL